MQRRPCFDGELAGSGAAEQSAVLGGLLVGGEDAPSRGSLGAFCCWWYKECLGGPLSTPVGAPYAQPPTCGCHCYYPSYPPVLGATCFWPRKSSAQSISLLWRRELLRHTKAASPESSRVLTNCKTKVIPENQQVSTNFQNSNWILGPLWFTGVHTVMLFFHYILSKSLKPLRSIYLLS